MAMGYVARDHAADGTALDLMVRGKPLPARVAPDALRPPPLRPLKERQRHARAALHQGP